MMLPIMSMPIMDTPLSDSTTYSYHMIWCTAFFVFVTSGIQDLLRFVLVVLGY